MTSKLPLILNIETSTKNCSVALFSGSNLISEKSLLSEKHSHSETLTLFVEDVIKKSNYTLVDLDAISISKGPGSYTGLRIGVSTAKGLSYSLNRPLISVSTLRSMAFYMSQKQSNYDLYCPMIDARRMEVFSSFYDKDNNQVRAVMADIIDENSYNKELKNKVLFFGDGSNKCKDVLTSGNAYFTDNFSPSAKYMGILSLEKYNNKDFEDVAYLEPFYLKDFVVGKKN